MPNALDLRTAWRRGDLELERSAIAFWRRLDILPPDVRPEDRARELCTVAFVDGEAAGVASASLETLPFLRARFAMLRTAVSPEHRRQSIADAMACHARDVIESWSREHPEEAIMGLGAIIQGAALETYKKRPVWPTSRLNLVGYTLDGQQIRVAWFEHARAP